MACGKINTEKLLTTLLVSSRGNQKSCVKRAKHDGANFNPTNFPPSKLPQNA